jgi:hypothetical protein
MMTTEMISRRMMKFVKVASLRLQPR